MKSGTAQKMGAEYDHDLHDDQAWPGEGEPDGEHATDQPKLVDRGTRMIMEGFVWITSRARTSCFPTWLRPGGDRFLSP